MLTSLSFLNSTRRRNLVAERVAPPGSGAGKCNLYQYVLALARSLVKRGRSLPVPRSKVLGVRQAKV